MNNPPLPPAGFGLNDTGTHLTWLQYCRNRLDESSGMVSKIESSIICNFHVYLSPSKHTRLKKLYADLMREQVEDDTQAVTLAERMEANQPTTRAP